MKAQLDECKDDMEKATLKVSNLEQLLDEKMQELSQLKLSLQESERVKIQIENLTHENAQLQADLNDTEKRMTESDKKFTADLRRLETETAALIADTRETQNLESMMYAEKEKVLNDRVSELSNTQEAMKNDYERKMDALNKELVHVQEMRNLEVMSMEKEIENLRVDNTSRSRALQELAAQHDISISKLRDDSAKELKSMREKMTEQTSTNYKEKTFLSEQAREAQNKYLVLEVKHNEAKRKLEAADQIQSEKYTLNLHTHTLSLSLSFCTHTHLIYIHPHTH